MKQLLRKLWTDLQSSAAIANGGLPTVTVEEAVQCSKTNIQMQQSPSLDLDTSFGKYFYQKLKGVGRHE